MSTTPLLLQALAGTEVSRPPVWMMRQAGRHLPEYMELREKYDFFTRVETPELAAEITLQPMRRYEPDAAIIFSDILVIPKALGMEVQLIPGKGPVLPHPIKSLQDVLALQRDGVADRLQHVYDALRLVRAELSPDQTLIGFAGAPWTILCYMVEGHGSKTFSEAKKFCYNQPQAAELLLNVITEATIAYCKLQIEAGAQVIQVFDSWSGLLSPEDFENYAQPYLLRISDAISEIVPVILYPKGSWYALSKFRYSSCAALGVDWTLKPQVARDLIGKELTIQGNLDPSILLTDPETVHRKTTDMIKQFGTQRYIANLGHGISPDVPPVNAKAFFDAVKSYQPS